MGSQRWKCSAGNEPRLCKWGNSAPGGQSIRAGFDLATRKGDTKKDSIAAESSTNLRYCDGGVSEEEELVYAGNQDGPNEPDDPGSEGGRRHRGIICVGNRRTDFWIRRLVLERSYRRVKIWVVVVIRGDFEFLRVPDNRKPSVSAASTPKKKKAKQTKLTNAPPR